MIHSVNSGSDSVVSFSFVSNKSNLDYSSASRGPHWLTLVYISLPGDWETARQPQMLRAQVESLLLVLVMQLLPLHALGKSL